MKCSIVQTQCSFLSFACSTNIEVTFNFFQQYSAIEENTFRDFCYDISKNVDDKADAIAAVW